MAQAVGRRLVTAEASIQSEVSLCDFCGGQSATGTGFFPDYFGFPCQYHSTNAPYLRSLTRCSYQKDEWTRLDNPSKNMLFRKSGNIE